MLAHLRSTYARFISRMEARLYTRPQFTPYAPPSWLRSPTPATLSPEDVARIQELSYLSLPLTHEHTLPSGRTMTQGEVLLLRDLG